MRIGYTTMNTPSDMTPRELAPLLEASGFDSLWIGEHSHIPTSRRTPYPTGGEMPWQYTTMMDPFIALAVAAEHSTNLRLGLGVALPLEHDIFVLAKKTATLDLLSGGRVEFGVGAGWNVEELHDHRPDIEWSQRYLALGESVEALRALWTDDEAEHHGRWFDFDAVWCRPKPAQKPHPRVWYGTGGRIGTRHAVRYADGWLPLDVTLGNVPKFVGRFRDACLESGRENVPISMVAFGDPSLDTLLEYRDLGIDRVVVGSGRSGWEDPSGVPAFIDRYAAFVDRVA